MAAKVKTDSTPGRRREDFVRPYLTPTEVQSVIDALDVAIEAGGGEPHAALASAIAELMRWR